MTHATVRQQNIAASYLLEADMTEHGHHNNGTAATEDAWR